MIEASPSIAELARRCSESSREFFECLGADLDRRRDALSASLEARRLARQPRGLQSASHATDESTDPALSESPESLQVPDLLGDRKP